MGWARIDDGFDDHPKVLALLEDEQGAAAVGLWTLCLTYAHRTTRKVGKTPGLIPAGLPRRYVGPDAAALVALLVKAGMWDVAPDGWLIHDFGEYLPSEETRAARAAAGRRGAQSRWGAERPPDSSEPSTSWQDDGKLPFEDGNLPSASHDVDSNAIASDGSRADARRDPTPVPEPIPTKTASSTKTPSRTGSDDDPAFVAFWSAYPRKTDKGHGRKAWAKALKTGADPAAIVLGAQAYATYCARDGTPGQYIPHPATWLTGERWSDERVRPATSGHTAYRNPENPADAYDPGKL